MDIIKALWNIREGLSNQKDKKDTLLQKFDEVLRNHPEISDEEMCFLLYGHRKKTSEYRVIKHRYEQKLQDEVMSYCGAQKNLDNYTFRSLVAEKNYLIILALYKNGFQNVAIKLIEKNYAFCKNNDFVAISLQLSELLAKYYGFINPNISLFEKYMKENKYLSELIDAEYHLKRYSTLASHWYVMQKGGLRQNQIEEYKKMVDHGEILFKNYFSRNNFLNFNNIAHYYYILTSQAQKSLELALQASKIQQEHFPDDRMTKYSIAINIGLSYFRLNDYQNAANAYQQALMIPAEGHRMWLEDGLIYFVILLRLKDYNKMFEVYFSHYFHKNISNFKPIHEQWMIREAFIHLLIESEMIAVDWIPENYKHKFYIKKFLNSVPIYTKDKEGLYVTILILKIIFALLTKKYDALENIYENLTQYAHKHLKRKDSLRSYYFIKMLSALNKADYHPVLVQTYARVHYNKLIQEAYTLDNYKTMIELLPYDDLWAVIIRVLENNQSQSQKNRRKLALGQLNEVVL